MTVSLHHGDGIAGLASLTPGCVSLVIGDPPWGATRAPWDRSPDWPSWWAAIDRALAPRGIVVVFASVRLAIEMAPHARRRFAYDLVWKKNRASGHLNAARQPLRGHESLLVFGDAARGPAAYNVQFTDGHPPMGAATRVSKSVLYGRETVTTSKAGSTIRRATSVLSFDVVPNDSPERIHPTQKPLALLRWLIRAYSQPGDLVADPMCGSAASLRAARAEGRRAIGWDVDAETVERARAALAGEAPPPRARHATGQKAAAE